MSEAYPFAAARTVTRLCVQSESVRRESTDAKKRAKTVKPKNKERVLFWLQRRKREKEEGRDPVRRTAVLRTGLFFVTRNSAAEGKRLTADRRGRRRNTNI